MGLVSRLHVLVILLLFQHGYASQCYWPNGQNADAGYVPCNSTASVSACCAATDACTTEGWCLGSAGFPYRGGCTDQSWKSGVCQRDYCQGISSTFAQLFYCGDIGESSPNINNFCCQTSQGSLTSCCKNNFSFSSLSPSGGFFTGKAFIPDLVDKANIPASTTAAAQSNAASAAGICSAATVTSTSQSAASSKGGISAGAIAGAVIGALIGGILIGIVGACIFSTRQARKNYQSPGAPAMYQAQEPMPYSNHQAPYTHHQTLPNGQVTAAQPKPELDSSSPDYRPYKNYDPAEVAG